MGAADADGVVHRGLTWEAQTMTLSFVEKTMAAIVREW